MRFLVPIVGLISVLALLGGLKACQISTLIGAGREAEKVGPPPEVVSAAPALRQTWEQTLDAVATVVSEKGVAVSNDAPGVVSRLHFESGQTVKKDQILVELDTSVERAQLRAILARREGAEIAVNRSRVLAEEGVVPQAQRDADESAFRSLSAEAGALRAQIERKIVRAPFAGKLGIREVNLGQYLAPGTTVALLESAESVDVEFTLPQQNLSILEVGMPVRVSSGAADTFVAEGTIGAIDPRVDPETRAVNVRASLPKNERLRPGMFLSVEVLLPEPRQVVAIPLTAVQRASYGDSVFTVEDKKPPGAAGPAKIARQQFVRLGEERGDFVSVLDGVRPGQLVVTSGGFKLRGGMPIVVSDDVKLDPKLSPRPENR